MILQIIRENTETTWTYDQGKGLSKHISGWTTTIKQLTLSLIFPVSPRMPSRFALYL